MASHATVGHRALLLSCPRQVARPEGSEHALPTFVIEGVGELV